MIIISSKGSVMTDELTGIHKEATVDYFKILSLRLLREIVEHHIAWNE